MIEKVTFYKTSDRRTFAEKSNTIAYENLLKSKKELTEMSKKVKQLFKEELARYTNDTKRYCGIDLNGMDLECDFWEDIGESLAHDANVDITIENFEEYVSLIKALSKDFHLEKTIKVIKKIMCNDIKEIV